MSNGRFDDLDFLKLQKAPTDKDLPGALHAENMTGSAEPVCLREGTLPSSRYARAWALYFSKFLTACKCI